MCSNLSRIDIVQVVLDELYGGAEIRLVELIGDVPADWTKLPALLHGGMEEGDPVQHWLPLHHVRYIKQFLVNETICTLEAGLHSLRRLSRELDGRL